MTFNNNGFTENGGGTRRGSGGDTETQEPNILTIDDEETKEVLDSVSSETAREILSSVQESEKTPAALADGLGTSTQNVRYHLDKLEAAGLVEVGGTRYSEKGREMSVYEYSETAPVVVIGVREELSLSDETEDARRSRGDDRARDDNAEDDSRERVPMLYAEDKRRGASRPSARPG